MCPILYGYGDTAIEIKKIQVIHIRFLNVKSKEKQITVKFVIINLQTFSKIPPSTSIHFAARL
jgi:hypothetical protein